ncbi:MAG: hypothetical protein ACI9DO_002254 [Reinekea sp.]|jgi:hypothetical protein
MDPSQHVIDNAQAVTKVGGLSAGSSPLLYWMVDNSEVISLMLGLGGFTLAAAGFTVAWVYNHKRFKILKQQFQLQIQDRERKYDDNK